jgi:glycosyltransferase involved in cell wall biosynthesis
VHGLRVLVLNDLPSVPGPGYGGAEVSIGRISRALRRAGHQVREHSRPGPHSGPSRALALWDPMERRRVREVMESFRPHVVHAHNVLRELSPSVLLACSGVPVVMTVHDLRVVGIVQGLGSSLEQTIDRRVKQPLDTKIIRRVVTHYAAVSQVAAKELAAAGISPVTVVPPPGPDWDLTAPPAASCRDLVVIARLTPDKGVDVALDAFASLSADFPDTRLVIVGEGPDGEALQSRGVPNVVFTGRQSGPQVAAQIARARAVVVPSLPGIRPETSSLTTIEAASMGRPVIGSSDPAVASLVTSLGCGVVVPAGDVTALANAMRTLLSSDARVAEIAAVGERNARLWHAPEAVAMTYAALYRSVISPDATIQLPPPEPTIDWSALSR